jgi:hypothetical protein
MAEIEVLAHKTSTAKFTITADSRPEAEKAIAERLRSNKELVWTDDSERINVDCIWSNNIWRPRRRFSASNDGGE